MSTLVVVKKGNTAVIAADSLSTYGTTLLPPSMDAAPQKMLQVGDTVIGLVGSAAHCLVLEDLLSARKDEYSFNSVREIFKSFHQMHPILKKEYYLSTEEDEDSPYESSQIDALLVNPTGIYGVHSLREVYQYTRFWATGSGWTYALGALQVLYDRHESAAEIAKESIKAACVFDQASELPVALHEVPLG